MVPLGGTGGVSWYIGCKPSYISWYMMRWNRIYMMHSMIYIRTLDVVYHDRYDAIHYIYDDLWCTISWYTWCKPRYISWHRMQYIMKRVRFDCHDVLALTARPRALWPSGAPYHNKIASRFIKLWNNLINQFVWTIINQFCPQLVYYGPNKLVRVRGPTWVWRYVGERLDNGLQGLPANSFTKIQNVRPLEAFSTRIQKIYNLLFPYYYSNSLDYKNCE